MYTLNSKIDRLSYDAISVYKIRYIYKEFISVKIYLKLPVTHEIKPFYIYEFLKIYLSLNVIIVP